MNVLINAYAVSPNWGSEQGVGWKWAINIAEHCNVYVITEGQWRSEIEKNISNLPQRDNLHFYYIPVSDKIRRMCWNQGDWRFYFHYHIWQKKALKLAREIIITHKIDIIHQLNMVGFREPGLLWKIKEIPFVLGPIAGRTHLNLKYFSDVHLLSKTKYAVKNIINSIQFNYSPNVKNALKYSRAVITPMEDMADDIAKRYNVPVYLIPETGLDETVQRPVRNSDKTLHLLWVGRFVERKQLSLALRTIARLDRQENVKLHIVGFGMNGEEQYYRSMAEKLGISENCVWEGKKDNAEVKEMMTQMDVFFFTSVDEVTSTVIPEAIQSCLPIICHNICGFGPLVNNEIGWTIPLLSPEESIAGFARIINNICQNPKLLDKDLREFEKTGEKLKYKSKALQVVDIYKSIIG